MKRLSYIIYSLLVLLSAQPLSAKIRLPKLVSDRMVLQRDTELKIWGWADPAEKVTVRFRGSFYNTEADDKGNWQVMLPAQTAGGPFIMEVNELTIRDVLVGDVWLMSGQSNQETPIHRLVEKFPEIPVSNNHMIRHYKVPTQDSKEELKEEIAGDAVWHSATSSEVMNWTSLAYFFAVETYNYTGLPVGVIVSSLGGSSIQSWVSQEHLKEVPRYVVDQEAFEAVKQARQDKGEGLWYKKDWNDSDWQTIDVPSTWAEKGIQTKGAIWYRKSFVCPASMVGRHAKLYMGRMADDDRVYVNGCLVGHTTYFGPPRKYDVPAGVLVEGVNNITLRLEAVNGYGEIVPDKPYLLKGDADEVNLEGEWKYAVGYDKREADKYADRLKNLRQAGSGLYNGMIYPIRHWKVRGAVWYQGESNTGRPDEYYPMLKGLVENWRELWNMPDMPFFLVQLPNYMKKHDKPTDSGWARLREAQLKAALTIPSTSLAVTYDVGEWNDIHPLDKKSVAKRLFLGAKKLAYGEKLVCQGPVYKDMKIEGNRIILTFDTQGRGLKSRGGALKHFAIAGEDRKFVWADAVIKGNKVVVSSSEIDHPVAVRYAWSDNPSDANLCNKDGLLASPFRTDVW